MALSVAQLYEVMAQLPDPVFIALPRRMEPNRAASDGDQRQLASRRCSNVRITSRRRP